MEWEEFLAEAFIKLQEIQIKENKAPVQEAQCKKFQKEGINHIVNISLDQSGRIDNHNDTVQISDLDLGPTLGTGTFGRVRMVKFKNDKTNKSYALKMLKKTEIIRLSQVDHIQSEKAILQLIDFPFVVKLYHSFQDQKYIYMLLEFIGGGELFSRLRKEGRFSPDVSLFYISQIIITICHLHRQEIVYRDLKPENLLIDNEGHIKVTDFGFAKELTNDKTYTLCGTPEYLAPEIIKGSKVGYGKSVDI